LTHLFSRADTGIMTDIEDAIESAVTSPRRVASDNTSVDAHSLADLIAMDKHLARKAYRNSPAAMLVHTKLVPPGTA